MTNAVELPKVTSSAGGRLESLDQFRGYTVLGMMLVNYFGGYTVCPQILKHSHDYCSYADTIMPQFLFAVGFALRLSFGRRMQTQGSVAAYGRMVRRLLGLVLVSVVIYGVGQRAPDWEHFKELSFWDIFHEPLKRSWFQTLMHIAVTSLWLLPVVHCKAGIRIAWMLASALAHVGLSYWFNFVWVNTDPNGIDGGPLGFLTWTVPAVVGTIACDVFLQPREKLQLFSKSLFGVFVASLILMLIGWVMSCGTRLYDVPAEMVESLKQKKLAEDPVWPSAARIEAKRGAGWEAILAEPPFVKPPDQSLRKWNYWMMSQRGGTLSYPTFAAGFSLLVFLIFFVVSDLWSVRLAVFRTFGTNALIAYVLHSMIAGAVKPFFPKDAPAAYSLLGLAIYFVVTWMFVRHLEKQGAYLRA